jgi:mannonate dehydratase
MSAIAAVDVALWDIKAKVAGLPLYQLLGGASRTGVMVYGHANGATIEDTINEALKYKAMGYKAIRLQTGVPGLPSTYGVSGDKLFYEPADAALPDRECLVDQQVPAHRPQAVRSGAQGAGRRGSPAA